MHATLPTHVLALAPDSLATIGQIDPDGLAELWSVFTRCKDSLQNGRRLENLSWRLWFDSGRRDPDLEDAVPKQNGDAQAAVPEEWSDPEWEETSDSESSVSSGEDADRDASGDGDGHVRAGRPTLARKAATTGSSSVSPQSKVHARPRTTSVPAAAAATAPTSPDSTCGGDGNGSNRVARPALARRGFSREGRPLHIISGNSLQRMIADLQRMPEIPPFGKARSLSDVPAATAPVKPPLGSRGSSAPDGLNSASRHASAPTSPTFSPAELENSSKLRSRRTSSDVSPALSRANSSPAPASTSTTFAAPSGSTEPPAPTPALHRRFPSNLAMSALPRTRRSRPASPSSSPPSREGADVPLTPSETAMLAVAESRNRSDVNLHKRTQSTADLAASFRPASFVKGFEPSPTSLDKPTPSVCVPTSVDARPGPGAIAPPPTPANRSAALAPSPPRNAAVSLSPPVTRQPSRTPASSLVSPPSTRSPPPVPSSSVVSTAHSHQSNASAGPSAMHGRRKGPGASKKIFFISSPDSDEEHSSRSRSSGMRVIVTPPSAKRVMAGDKQEEQKSASPAAAPAASAAEADNGDGGGDEDEWASDSDDDDASSGWGSEYSTESDEPRPGTRAGGRNQAFDAKTAFAKRAPSDLQRTASTATVSGSASNWGGGPGELKRPGLLSQLFHPDQFVEEPERKRSSLDLLRRQHQSSPALAMLGRQPSQHGLGSADGRDKQPPKTVRTKSFLKGKPEHVELESSSDEDEDEREAAAASAAQAEAEAQRAAAAALARRQRELEEVVAPPQTPRTTRRAMLATELSESLRRNLLWERQTRNRVLGGQPPRRPMMPGEQLPPRPASSTNLAQQQQQAPAGAPTPPPGVTRTQTDNNRTNHTSAAAPTGGSRRSPPPNGRIAGVDPPPRERHAGTAALPRRHTTGTGLYLQAMAGGQFPGARRGRGEMTESEDSDSSDDDGGTASPADAFGSSIAGQRVW
ncbi:hypothetical protein C6P46_000644 [Rhodotorula mucilaginosa]|uniref:Nitrogen regulatory protein areA GATA-like domain-containing protein n=1 Tax=Rhodotorula mucilaginosa TaxID=5537 RepID=A0A9P7B955_RHOMI|nr:hypothetical protein C6P46_000644 [Rhodotorula mucilaginosa]